MRQPNPAANIALTEKIYAMDARQQAAVVATADKQIHVFDMTGECALPQSCISHPCYCPSAGRKISEFKSPLTYQTRCVSIFNDQ